ncbi:hypothetical protein [Streptomyces sp. NPDC050804]|uniref:hypothetical protein n=1 Tax=unclassified Streptomyces TaxID=2593676 RepID=UPI0034405CC0|nr:hypothetical protein OG214_02525 [Streptomyces sp. NBC_00872]
MKWTITVEASDGSVDEAPATITAVMQRGADGTPRIVELIVRASEEGGIPPRAALDIDFEMLARAVSGVASRTPSQTPSQAAPAHSRDEAESLKRAATTPVVEGQSERPYRKMPDADEVKGVFLETGSVGKVARHYGVPRYTAQSWVDRLRRMGHLEETTKPGDSRRARG